MDMFIDARLDRVEKALTTVIDSIAKYNPSPALAEDLLAADRELSDGLEELQKHQNNYERILALRDDVAAFDAQIKSTLLTLAASRRDMLATPATVFPGDDATTRRGRKTRNYNFTYDELMSYARRISRNTVPAPGQTDGAEFFGTFGYGGGGGGAANADTVGATTTAGTPATAMTTPAPLNGTGTPHPGPDTVDTIDTPGTTTGGGPAAGGGGASGAGNGTGNGTGAAGPPGAAATPAAFAGIATPTNVPDVLPPDYQQYVAPAAGTIFFPWPMPDLMLHGGLRAMQAVIDQNRDAVVARPIRFVSLEEQEQQEEQERQRVAREAAEREAREQHQRRMAVEAAAAAAAVGGSRAGEPRRPAAAPAQFASTLDMDDD